MILCHHIMFISNTYFSWSGCPSTGDKSAWNSASKVACVYLSCSSNTARIYWPVTAVCWPGTLELSAVRTACPSKGEHKFGAFVLELGWIKVIWAGGMLKWSVWVVWVGGMLDWAGWVIWTGGWACKEIGIGSMLDWADCVIWAGCTLDGAVWVICTGGWACKEGGGLK